MTTPTNIGISHPRRDLRDKLMGAALLGRNPRMRTFDSAMGICGWRVDGVQSPRINRFNGIAPTANIA